jgi:outer membrane protein insertion porin family
MEYDTYAISVGLRTGVRVPTAVVGEFRVDPYFNSALEYKTYDRAAYRPFDPDDRAGWKDWIIENMLGVSLAWDKRDYYVNPQSGFYLTQNFLNTGGLILGNKHYLKTRTLAEAYLTVLDRPVTDSYAFKIVLGVHSSLSFILPQWHLSRTEAGASSWGWGTVIDTGDKLYLDGMTNARGWRNVSPGLAMWESQLELRIPISEQLLWFALFFDGAGVWDAPAAMGSMSIEDYYFSFGGGLRFTHPQFPIRLYLSKGFRLGSDGRVSWKDGDLDLGALSLDFVISLGGVSF